MRALRRSADRACRSNNPGRARRGGGRSAAPISRRSGSARRISRRAATSIDFRKRAAILHTDAALLESLPVVVAAADRALAEAALARATKPSRASTSRASTAASSSFELANPHWQFAMDLLDALPATPQRDPIVAQWYRAIGAYFAQRAQFRRCAQAFRAGPRARVPTIPTCCSARRASGNLGAPRDPELRPRHDAAKRPGHSWRVVAGRRICGAPKRC